MFRTVFLPVASSSFSLRSYNHPNPRPALLPDTLPIYRRATEELRRLRPYTGGFPQQPLCHSWGTTESRSSFPEWWWFLQPSPGLLLANNHMWTWKQALNHSRMRSAGPKSQSLRHHCQKPMVDCGWWRWYQSLSAILVVRAHIVTLLLSLTLCSDLLPT